MFRALAVVFAVAVIGLGAAQSSGSTPPVTASSKCVSHAGLPALRCTPGALNKNVKQSNIKSNICVPNWTDTVRPPTSYTNKLKIQGLRTTALRTKSSATTKRII